MPDRPVPDRPVPVRPLADRAGARRLTGGGLRPRPVAASVDELLRDATRREPMATNDSKSGARFERVVIGDRGCVVKYLTRDDDWIMRALGDLGCKPLQVWESGVLDLVPGCIDPAMLGAARDGERGAAILMEDVSEWLVPEGDDPVPLGWHVGFVDHLAAFHAAFWGFDDADQHWTPLANRWACWSAEMVACEEARGLPEAVPRIVRNGWSRFAKVAGPARDAVLALRRAPWPLLDALRKGPQTFVQGDWKMGNLGRHPDGRTILLDWANPGAAPGLIEVGWYLALNRARIPPGAGHEATLSAYREALRRHGVDPSGWWDKHVALNLLGILVMFGWEKALGDAEELAWWEDQACRGLHHLR